MNVGKKKEMAVVFTTRKKDRKRTQKDLEIVDRTLLEWTTVAEDQIRRCDTVVNTSPMNSLSFLHRFIAQGYERHSRHGRQKPGHKARVASSSKQTREHGTDAGRLQAVGKQAIGANSNVIFPKPHGASGSV